MRTNIEIDDKLMKQAMKATGATTKKAVVEEALKRLVWSKKQHAALQKLRGSLKDGGWEPAPEGKDKWKEAELRHAREDVVSRKSAA